MEQHIWLCSVCLETYIGKEPGGSRCPGCCGNGQPKGFHWYYKLDPERGAVWVATEAEADGQLYL